jgi:hypothetical protein
LIPLPLLSFISQHNAAWLPPPAFHRSASLQGQQLRTGDQFHCGIRVPSSLLSLGNIGCYSLLPPSWDTLCFGSSSTGLAGFVPFTLFHSSFSSLLAHVPSGLFFSFHSIRFAAGSFYSHSRKLPPRNRWLKLKILLWSTEPTDPTVHTGHFHLDISLRSYLKLELSTV